MTTNEGAARPAFDELATELETDGVSVGTMFGHLALMRGGKGIGCLEDDTMVFRLGSGTPAHAEAMAVHGAHLFDPSKTGRAMKDWVVVPTSTQGRWSDWARAAIEALPG